MSVVSDQLRLFWAYSGRLNCVKSRFIVSLSGEMAERARSRAETAVCDRASKFCRLRDAIERGAGLELADTVFSNESIWKLLVLVCLEYVSLVSANNYLDTECGAKIGARKTSANWRQTWTWGGICVLVSTETSNQEFGGKFDL